MLAFEMQGDTLRVTETIMGWTRTEVRHVYFDTKNWLVSGRHTLGAKPDLTMTESAIAWVKQHYLPKVGAC